MKNLNIKIILILLISLLFNNVSDANIVGNMDTLTPIQIDSMARVQSIQRPMKYILVKDNETEKEIIFEEGDQIIYYRKDRNKKYRKTIETITDNGFIVKNQNVKLSNIAKIKQPNILQGALTKVLPILLIVLSTYLIVFFSIQLASLLGSIFISLFLFQIISFIVGGLILLTIAGLMIRSSSRKKSNFFDLEKGATARIFNKK